MQHETKELLDTWTSPDGKVKIWTVKDQDGKPHKTMSKAVSEIGFTGEVEEYTNDKGNKYIRQPQSEDGQRSGGGGKSFKADPEKMKQDRTLEIARNKSIQRQVSVKGAVDLIVAEKRTYAQLRKTFNDLMELLENKVVIDPDDNSFEITEEEK